MKRRLTYLLLGIVAVFVVLFLIANLAGVLSASRPAPVFHAPNGQPIPKS